MKVSFYKHSLGKKEIDNFVKVIRSETLSTGNFCEKFESLFSKRFSSKFCTTFSSWTMGSYLLWKNFKFNSKDEVIVSPLTWVSSINTLVLAGAKPVFADVDIKTGLIDPKSIEKKITKNTKAVLVVHLYGQMCDMRKISKICNKNNLKLIEDSAHCIEGQRDGVKPGQLSYASIFSFYATKNITCGEGGAIITNDKLLDQKLRLARYHGKKNLPTKHSVFKHWDIKNISLKCNMTDISASILIPQLKKINLNLQKRKKIWKKYLTFFRKFKNVTILERVPNSIHAMHLFTFTISSKIRDKVLDELLLNKIGASIHYKSVSELQFYKKKIKSNSIKNAVHIGRSIITLPLYPSLKLKEMDYIFKNLNIIFKKFKIN